METFYRYRVEPFHWMFTNALKAAATIRYDLYYVADSRGFRAQVYRRFSHFAGWGHPVEVLEPRRIERLRALLEPTDIAACAAASMMEVDDV